MTTKKKRITKHVVGDACHLVNCYLTKHKQEKHEFSGIEFSNLGAQGRHPLFDVSRSQKGTIMAYWKDEHKKYIVITAPEPGFEIRAPKNMRGYFWHSKITHLDVSHLDVSNTTDFSRCFSSFGYGGLSEKISSEIIGLENWDVSKGENFAFMFDSAFPANKSISLDLSSWKFNQNKGIRFWNMFQGFGLQANKVILDVSGWNTTNVYDFDQMFKQFAPHAKTVELRGIEDWCLGTGSISLDYTFDGFAKESSCCLDLSKWSIGCAQKPRMENFSNGVFFRIKEPRWAN